MIGKAKTIGTVVRIDGKPWQEILALADQLLAAVTASNPAFRDNLDAAYVQAFVALSRAGDARAQAIADSGVDEDDETYGDAAYVGQFGIVEELVDDYGAEHVIKWAKDADDGYDEASRNHEMLLE